MPRNILPWVLLAVAVVVAITVLRRPAPPGPVPMGSAIPPIDTVLPPGAPSVSGPPSARAYNDPPMTEEEVRDWHLKVGHESCEEGAKMINTLQGLEPTDKQGIKFIGACLRNGNVAWYKCLVKAQTRLEAGTCNRRFLNGGNNL